MKTFSNHGPPEPLTAQTARGCAGTNLALPGFGSLMAGRTAGIPQAVLTVTAFALTLICGIKFIVWAAANWTTLHEPEADPVESLLAIWRHARWALLGIALFAASWLWALATNVAILRAAAPRDDAGKPPKLR